MRGMSSVSPVDVELKRASTAWVLVDRIFVKALSMLFTTVPLAGKLLKQSNLNDSERAEGCHSMMKRCFLISFCIRDPHSKGFVIMAFKVVTYRA